MLIVPWVLVLIVLMGLYSAVRGVSLCPGSGVWGVRGQRGGLTIVRGGGRAGEVEDAVDFEENGLSNVVNLECEVRVPDPVLDVFSCAGEEVVDDDDLVSLQGNGWRRGRIWVGVRGKHSLPPSIFGGTGAQWQRPSVSNTNVPNLHTPDT